MNLVETVRGCATPKFAEALSAVLGITPERIGVALDAALPSLLAAIAARCQTPEDAHSLARTLGEVDGAVLADPAGAIRSQGAMLMNRGGDLLGSLIGGAALTAVIGAIGRFTGKSPGSVRSIIGLTAPVVLACIQRERAAANLDEAGLAKLLHDQKPHIVAALPQGLAGALVSAANVGAVGEYLRPHAAPSAGRHGPPRPLIHVESPTARAQPAHAGHSSVSAGHGHAAKPRNGGHSASRGGNGDGHAHAHDHGGNHHPHHHHHHKAKRVPAWVWAAPAVGVLGLTGLIIMSTGDSGLPDAGGSEMIPASSAAGATKIVAAPPAPTPDAATAPPTAPPAAPTPATAAGVGEEVDSIINATALALGSVRDGATADGAVPALRDLTDRTDAAKRLFDRLPVEDQRTIGHRVSEALAGRLRNAFERAQGDDDSRRVLGSQAEALARKLGTLRPPDE